MAPGGNKELGKLNGHSASLCLEGLEGFHGGVPWHGDNGPRGAFPRRFITFYRGDVSLETCPLNACPARDLKCEPKENQLWKGYASGRDTQKLSRGKLSRLCAPAAHAPEM